MSDYDDPDVWLTSALHPLSFSRSLDLEDDENLGWVYNAMPPQRDHTPPAILQGIIKFLREARDDYFPTKGFLAQIKLKLELFKEKGEPLPSYERDDEMGFFVALKCNPELWATNGLAPLLHIALRKYIVAYQLRDLDNTKARNEPIITEGLWNRVLEKLLHELADIEIDYEGNKEAAPEVQERRHATHFREWKCITKVGAKLYDCFENKMEILILFPGATSCECGLCSWRLEGRQGVIDLSDSKLLDCLKELLLKHQKHKSGGYYGLLPLADSFFKRLQLLLRGKITASKILEEFQAAEKRLNEPWDRNDYNFYRKMFPEA